MNDDIRVVKHNGDSGRMAENALRQRFDERTQLNEHHAADVLRDTDATTMQDVATQEQRQTNLVHFEEEPAYSSAYEEESDPFETIFAETGFEFPSGTPERELDSNLKSGQREPLKEPDLGVEGARAVAAKTFADQSGKPGLSTPENVGQEVFSTGGTLDSSPDFRTEQREYRSPEGQSRDAQNADANFVTNRHKVWDAAAYFPQSESGGQLTAYQPPQQQAPSYQQEQEYETADGLFQTIFSESSFGQDAPAPQTTQSASAAQRAPDSGLRAVQRYADDQSRSAEASDPLAAMAAQRLLDNAKRDNHTPSLPMEGSNQAPMPYQMSDSGYAATPFDVPDGPFVSDGYEAPSKDVVPNRQSVRDSVPERGGRMDARSGGSAESRSSPLDEADPLAAMTAQRLVEKARQKGLNPDAGNDGINLVTDRHKVQDGGPEAGRSSGSRSVPNGESRSAPLNVEDPLAMHTTQVLLDKAKRKNRIDRMLNDNPEHRIDPDAVLKPSGAQPGVVLDAGAPDSDTRTPSASVSRFLRKPGAMLLKIGGQAAASAVLTSQLYEQQEGADKDAQSILNAAKDGGRGVRTLRRGIRRLQSRRTTRRAAQTGRAAAKAADEAVKKAAEGGGKKLFGAMAEGAKEMVAALAALVGGAITPVVVVILSIEDEVAASKDDDVGSDFAPPVIRGASITSADDNDVEEAEAEESIDVDPYADDGAGEGGQSEDVAETPTLSLTTQEAVLRGAASTIDLDSQVAGVTINYAADSTTSFKASGLKAGQVWVDKSVAKTSDTETSFSETLSVYANKFTTESEYSTGNYVLVLDTTRSLYNGGELHR